MLWRSFPHSASTRTPQPNKRQSVGAGRVGAIRRDHAARQCSAAHLGRVAALCTPCSLSGRLFTRCSSDLAVQLKKRTRRTKNACSNTRTALLVHGSAGMISAGSRRGSSHALVPWNREQAWSASGPSGGHAFSGRTDSNRLNTEQQIGHASVTRSRTLVFTRRGKQGPKASKGTERSLNSLREAQALSQRPMDTSKQPFLQSVTRTGTSVTRSRTLVFPVPSFLKFIFFTWLELRRLPQILLVLVRRTIN